MVYITDTHALVWYLTGDQKLGAEAKKIFTRLEKGKGRLLISLIVFLEVLVLVEKGRITFTWENFNEKIGQFPTAMIYPIGLDVLAEIKDIGNKLELHDRVLVTTTKIHEGVLITKDPEIKKIKEIKTVW